MGSKNIFSYKPFLWAMHGWHVRFFRIYCLGNGCYLIGHTGRFAGTERSSIYSLFNNNRSWTTAFQDDDNDNAKDKLPKHLSIDPVQKHYGGAAVGNTLDRDRLFLLK